MDSTDANLTCEVSTENEKEQQQKQNQQAENEKEIQRRASVDAEENSEVNVDQSNASNSSGFEPERNTTNDIVGVLESAVQEPHAAASKALDAITADLYPDTSPNPGSVDVLIQRIADLSAKIANLKDAHSLLKGTAVIVNKLEQICDLNKAADDLRTVRLILLNRREQAALPSSPIYNEFNIAVAAVETALTKTFETALLRVDTNALDIQKNLENLTADIGKAQNILLTIPDVLPKLDDEKIQFEETLRIFNEMQYARNTAQAARQALADSTTEKYILASEGLTLIRNALDNFEFIIEGKLTDYKGKESGES
ncbi:unnamed protein product [Taenia asiatica]|uniref:Dynactin subunit n=1 Tax=Taenia asiatica TaxID=60517 RepID=A0A0R3VWY1_TAEAS|nr:unnamed protein product [Taenia asiatica]